VNNLTELSFGVDRYTSKVYTLDVRTMINIKAEKDVKEKAQEVARELGMPLSTVINAYLRQFIRTKEVHFTLEGELKPSVKKRLDRLTKEAREGKNLSPAFSTTEEMDAYLDSLKT
jgi:addiction module RelB/DinJ family antitoxin